MIDLHCTPFETMVVLGESHVDGLCASSEGGRWVNVVADLISHFQGTTVALHNKGISANSISPRSPGYPASAKPSALDRYPDDVIALDPDLFILSYGLNDMRAGMPPVDFRDDMRQIICGVRAACDPVVVLTTAYYMTAYDLYPPFDKGSVEATEVYNLMIGQLGSELGCIVADVWSTEAKADWLIHPDTVHANNLGHAHGTPRVRADRHALQWCGRARDGGARGGPCRGGEDDGGAPASADIRLRIHNLAPSCAVGKG